MEKQARLDPNRLPRGRAYARRGWVGELAVEPGVVRAAVQGSRVTPYSVRVRVRAFDEGEWDRFLDAVAARAANTAALLDGVLPPEVVSDAAQAGVDLLPGPGEVGPRCSCPDWADPCKHSAAVVYLMADVLDADPFALLLLRGRGRDEVLAGLRQRWSRRSAGGRTATSRTDGAGTRGRPGDQGVVARDAYAATLVGQGPGPFPAAAGDGPGPQPATAGDGPARPPLPAVPLAPRRPGNPAPLAVDPPPASGLRAIDLADLAADAARRAWELCQEEGDGGLHLDAGLDLIRRVALPASATGALVDGSRVQEVAARTGRKASDLGRQATAWRLGGADAVVVLDEIWSPDADALDEGRAAVAALVGVRVRGNRVTLPGGTVQLRLSRGGAWYRFERTTRDWQLTGGPVADPAQLVQAAPAPHP